MTILAAELIGWAMIAAGVLLCAWPFVRKPDAQRPRGKRRSF